MFVAGFHTEEKSSARSQFAADVIRNLSHTNETRTRVGLTGFRMGLVKIPSDRDQMVRAGVETYCRGIYWPKRVASNPTGLNTRVRH